MAQSLRLADYYITPDRGFLSSDVPAWVSLPPDLGPAVCASIDLPRTMISGRIRAHLEQLPVIDLTRFCAEGSEPQLRSAMVRYSFMVQAYVWGEKDPPKSLPA